MTFFNKDKIINETILSNKDYVNSNSIKLVIILASDDESSKVYIEHKINFCKKNNINVELITFDYKSTDSDIIGCIKELNTSKQVNVILLQLPLFNTLNCGEIIRYIDPVKDVDGFSPLSLGNQLIGQSTLRSATASSIIKILNFWNLDLKNKRVVVIGRSIIIGIPLISWLLTQKATVISCDINELNLKEITRISDVVITAIGKKHYFDASYFKEDSYIIDVGITKENERVYGDVNFDSVIEKTKYITPVPGGVGPLTILSLYENLIVAHKLQNKGSK